MADVTAQCAQSWAGLGDKQKYENKAGEDKKKYDEKLCQSLRGRIALHKAHHSLYHF